MICYITCGSNKTKRRGKSTNQTRTGRLADCLNCKKGFIQGGLKDFQKYHLVLEKRIMDLNLPEDVEAEVFQIASMVMSTTGRRLLLVSRPQDKRGVEKRAG